MQTNLFTEENQPERLRKLEQLGFIKISDFPVMKYLPYQEHIRQSDLAYSLLYAWEFAFGYRIRVISENPVITGFNSEGGLFFSVIPCQPESFMDTVDEAVSLLKGIEPGLMLKYIHEPEARALEARGFAVSYSLDYSDYIYKADEFVSIAGKKNNSKRHEYNRMAQNVPAPRYCDLEPEQFEDVRRVFSDWCSEHSCSECIWGCEKNACLRLLEHAARYPERFIAGAVYLEGVPRSFGIAERINQDCVCYHVQKNSIAAGGLTYYLHHHMACRHLDVPYINWGEDMGIMGLRFNKQKYHPCAMEHKYEIRFQ
ncbi:MAG: DUF2156 domain-containing protein [Ruminococcaceae bacterium]|nr:DUF2156 domain-containing protein [Oscillospiraceae bacterium]